MLTRMIVGNSNSMSLIETMTGNIIYNMINCTSKSIMRISQRMNNYSGSYACNIIDEVVRMDLEHSVSVISELANEIKEKDMPNSVKKALLGVNFTLEKIHSELNKLKNKLDNHQQKYFSKWRTIDCTENLNQIHYYKNLLDNRYHLLIDLLKIYL